MNAQPSRLKTNGTTRCHADRTRLHEHSTGRTVSLSAAEAVPADGSIELHAIDDSASIQRALSVVINAVAAGTLDPARAKVLLYGLQIASTNAHRMTAKKKPEETAPAIETADDRNILVTSSIAAPAITEPESTILDQPERRQRARRTSLLKKTDR